jgi:hypothetical protein
MSGIFTADNLKGFSAAGIEGLLRAARESLVPHEVHELARDIYRRIAVMEEQEAAPAELQGRGIVDDIAIAILPEVVRQLKIHEDRYHEFGSVAWELAIGIAQQREAIFAKAQPAEETPEQRLDRKIAENGKYARARAALANLLSYCQADNGCGVMVPKSNVDFLSGNARQAVEYARAVLKD